MPGFESQFLDKPPVSLQWECPICLQILREPYQVTCCGKCFCKDCIQPIHAKNQLCPTCNENFNCFQDKGFQQSLYGFNVFCSNKEGGCGWQGELGQLDQHLNVGPNLEKQLVGCAYTNVKCFLCDELYQRMKLEDHQNAACPKRPFTCTMCGEYESTYEDVTTNHAPECKCRPVECPNSCGARNLQHQHLDGHALYCPLEYVRCEFSDAGCNAKVYRRDLASHFSDNIGTHMSLLAQENRKLKQQLEKVQIEAKKQNQEHSKEIKRLSKEVERINFVRDYLMLDIFLPVNNSIGEWGVPSKPFYTHHGGYKLELSVLCQSAPTGNNQMKYTFLESEFKLKERCRMRFIGCLVNQEKGEHHRKLEHDVIYDKHSSSQCFVDLPLFMWDKFKKDNFFLFRIEKIVFLDDVA